MSELVFKGRDNEMQELLDFVADEAGGTFVVCGQMGMGKSRILQELANEIGPEMHWVHSFELPEKISIDLLFPLWIEQIIIGDRFFFTAQKDKWNNFFKAIPAIGQFINAFRSGPPQPKNMVFLQMLEKVSAALKHGQRCIILLDPDKEIADDDGAGNLKYILKRVPLRVKIIVAQRPYDRLMNDAVFLAEKGIRKFKTGNIDTLDIETIKQILHISTKDQDLELTGEGIERLAARIDGWPYAAELYLRWAALCMAENRLDDACTTPPDLQIVMQQLYEACKGNTHKVADWLTAARTPLSIPELCAVTGLSGEVVDEALADSNMRRLMKPSQSGRETYEIFHQDLKEYIGTRLAKRGDLKPMKARLGAHYRALLESDDAEQKALSLLHTTKYFKEANDKQAFIDAVMAQFETKFTYGLLAVCRDEMEQALAWARELNPEPKTISFFVGNLGLVYQNLGELTKAAKYHEQALAIAREIDDQQVEAQQLGNLGLVYRNLGELTKAAEHHEQALKIARKIGDRQGEAANLGNLGIVYFNLGELTKAAEYHKQALTIDQEIGYRKGEAQDLGNLGLVYQDLGKLTKAADYHEQALKIHRELGVRQGEAQNLGNLGLVYQNLGDFNKAAEYHEQALAIACEIGNKKSEANQLGNLGLVYMDLGELTKAAEYHEQALVINKEIGDRQGEAANLGNLGLVYAKQGELTKAAEYHEQALKIDREIGYRQGEAQDLGNLGNVYAQQGDKEKALKRLRQGLAIAEQIGAPPLIEQFKRNIEILSKQ